MEAVPACGDIYSEEKENLLDDLQQKNGALNKAVEAAEKLRLENIYLEETLENLRKEQSAVIENYEQENHTLKNKLSVSTIAQKAFGTSFSNRFFITTLWSCQGRPEHGPVGDVFKILSQLK